jgi:uncharacterized peroxidase-related enzyme
MTDFPVHTVDDAPEGSRAALAATTRAWGFTPKLQGVLAESPAALRAYEALFGLAVETGLSPAEQQIVFLTTSVFHGCEYCTMGHTFLAGKAGVPAAEVAALRAGGLPAEPRLRTLAAFTRRVLETRGDVGDAAVDGFVAAGFTRANVLDLLVIVAAKTISNYANHMAHTPKESFMSDPALAWTAPPRAA